MAKYFHDLCLASFLLPRRRRMLNFEFDKFSLRLLLQLKIDAAVINLFLNIRFNVEQKLRLCEDTQSLDESQLAAERLETQKTFLAFCFILRKNTVAPD